MTAKGTKAGRAHGKAQKGSYWASKEKKDIVNKKVRRSEKKHIEDNMKDNMKTEAIKTQIRRLVQEALQEMTTLSPEAQASLEKQRTEKKKSNAQRQRAGVKASMRGVSECDCEDKKDKDTLEEGRDYKDYFELLKRINKETPIRAKNAGDIVDIYLADELGGGKDDWSEAYEGAEMFLTDEADEWFLEDELFNDGPSRVLEQDMGSRQSDGARELELYIINDGELYNRHTKPVLKNLRRRMARGDYDSEKAIDLWEHLALAGAKKYHKEFGSPGFDWHELFPKSERREVARGLADHYENELEEL